MTPSSPKQDRQQTRAPRTNAASPTLPAGPDYWPVPPQPSARERSRREEDRDEQREQAPERPARDR